MEIGRDSSASGLKNALAGGAAALVLACVLWAGNFIVGRSIRGSIDPETLNVLRWIVACLAFLPFTYKRLISSLPQLWHHKAWLAGLTVTGVVGFQQATYTALTMSPVANAVLLLATTPLMIFVTSALMGQGTLGPMRMIAVGVSLLGVATILGDGNPLAVFEFSLGAGDLWLLAAVACWTAYTQLLRKAPKTIPGDVSLIASMLLALPLLAVLALVWGDTPIHSISLAAWSGVAYVGLGAALLAFLAWGYGVAQKGPDAAGLYLNLIPVFAIALAWLILGEAVSGGQFAGAALVVIALLIGHFARN